MRYFLNFDTQVIRPHDGNYWPSPHHFRYCRCKAAEYDAATRKSKAFAPGRQACHQSLPRTTTARIATDYRWTTVGDVDISFMQKSRTVLSHTVTANAEGIILDHIIPYHITHQPITINPC